MVHIAMLNPADLHHPVGPYSQVSQVTASRFVYLAGQTATDVHGNTVGVGDVEAQTRQVFANVEAGLRAAGATWANVVHFTNYLISHDDLPAFAAYRNGVFPTWFPNGAPPNTLLFVEKLLRKEFRVEVQAIAAL
jgi:enamine deaminase RidA (YjgF/YER057c/UK114 family)